MNKRLVSWGVLMFCGCQFGLAQETDFSPFARFGLGTDQGTLNPSLASMGGIVSVSSNNFCVNADQPAAAAGLTNPTFQGSVHLQRMTLTEGNRSDQAYTGSPGNFGLVIKQPRSRSALQLGLTPQSSKAFLVSRTTADTTLGNLNERYEGSGGLARAYLGAAHGWRGRNWVSAGADSVLISSNGLDVGGQFDHWFGDAIQTSTLDIEDISFRDVRTTISSRHRATGTIVGVEAFQVLYAKYDASKQFLGSLVFRLGGTWSPERTIETDYFRLVESTLIVNSVVTGIDTSAFDEADIQGTIPSKWTLGGGLQWDGPRGNRFGLFADWKRQEWTQTQTSLSYLMDGSGQWQDASSMALGVLWTPGRKPGRISRPTYRAGYSQSMLSTSLISSADGQSYPLLEQRLSFGFNSPLKGSRSASQFHFGMDFGRRYTELESNHQEINFRLHLGVTLTPFAKNLWLTPRLYD